MGTTGKIILLCLVTMKVEMDERRLAFAMALHNRLGESSIAHCLDEITMRGIVAHPVVEDVMIAIDDA